jgi:glycosyltransferase involved in cell wall biosynthesis
MRVAIVLSSFGGGGAERVAVTLAGGLHDLGVDVDLVVLTSDGPLRDAVPPGVKVVNLETRRASLSVLALRRYLTIRSPNAVLAIAFHISVLCSLAALLVRSRPRLVWAVHGSITGYLGALGHSRAIIMRTALSLLSRTAAEVVAVSTGAARDFSKTTGRSSVHVIYNPVRLPSIYPNNVDIKTKKIISVGRLVLEKSHRTLIDAFHEVVSRVDCCLEILGDGPLRGELEAHVARLDLQDRVVMPGFVDDVEERLSTSAVFVLSSTTEGLPTSLIEALGAGLPVVSTDCPHGPREILEDGRWGRLVPVNDHVALASAIVDALNHGGPDGRVRARQFSVEASAQEYFRILGSMRER